MIPKAFIFDLENTLVDIANTGGLIKDKKWSEVYEAIPSFKIYNGMPEILNELKRHNIPICIVSPNPGSFCEKVLEHFNIAYNWGVSLEDFSNSGQHLNPIEIALKKLGVHSNTAVMFGDDSSDITNANQANVFSVGCLWGSDDHPALLKSKPDYLVVNAAEIDVFLSGKVELKKIDWKQVN